MDRSSTPKTNVAITERPSPSLSVVPPPGSSSSPATCWAAHVTSAGVALSVVYAVAPTLKPLAEAHEWKAFGCALVALVVVAIPTGFSDVTELLKRLPILNKEK